MISLLYEKRNGDDEISNDFIDGKFIPDTCKYHQCTCDPDGMREEDLEVGDQSLRDAWAELMEALAVCESSDLKTVAVRFFTEK